MVFCKVVSRMSYQLPLTDKIFYLLTLNNLMFNCYVHIFAIVTILFLDLFIHFDQVITLEDGWSESTTETLTF